MAKSVNMEGRVFGRLTALRPTAGRTKNGGRIWVCRCSCGTVVEKSQQALRAGEVRSCGCLRKTSIRADRSKDQVWGVLEKAGRDGMTLPELCRAAGLSWPTVHSAIVRWHAGRTVYVCGWQDARCPRWAIVEEGLLDGEVPEDAPRPMPATGAQRVKKCREKVRPQAVSIGIGHKESLARAPVARIEEAPIEPEWWDSLMKGE